MNLLQERLLALERKHDGNGRAGFVTNAFLKTWAELVFGLDHIQCCSRRYEFTGFIPREVRIRGQVV
jgi:hypothetical protein